MPITNSRATFVGLFVLSSFYQQDHIILYSRAYIAVFFKFILVIIPGLIFSRSTLSCTDYMLGYVCNMELYLAPKNYDLVKGTFGRVLLLKLKIPPTPFLKGSKNIFLYVVLYFFTYCIKIIIHF